MKAKPTNQVLQRLKKLKAQGAPFICLCCLRAFNEYDQTGEGEQGAYPNYGFHLYVMGFRAYWDCGPLASINSKEGREALDLLRKRNDRRCIVEDEDYGKISDKYPELKQALEYQHGQELCEAWGLERLIEISPEETINL